MSELKEILIIDDHPIYISGLRDEFYKHPTSHYCISDDANTIAQARLALQNTYADIVLLDLKLPDESGADYCAELKKKYPDKYVIALTGETDHDILYQVWNNKVDAIIMKYCSVDEIIDVIRDIKNGKRVIGKNVPEFFTNPRKDSHDTFLTKKEEQIFRLLDAGFSRKEVANKLFVAHETVNTHCKNMFTKYKVSNLQALIKEVNSKR